MQTTLFCTNRIDFTLFLIYQRTEFPFKNFKQTTVLFVNTLCLFSLLVLISVLYLPFLYYFIFLHVFVKDNKRFIYLPLLFPHNKRDHRDSKNEQFYRQQP